MTEPELDMTNEESAEEFSISPVLRRRAQHSPADASEIFSTDGLPLRLHVREAVLSEIRHHAAGHPREEVGGIFLGRHYQSADGFVVIISDHVAVPSESKSSLHFEFDDLSVSAIFEGTENSAEYVVGWYHSHTDGMPFMSGADRRLHKDHFPHPWYVSCVVATGEWGMPLEFWHLLDGEVTALDGYGVEVASGLSASYSHERYLRACGMAEDSANGSAASLARLLPRLGMLADGELGRALGEVVSQDLTPPSQLSELKLLVALASSLRTGADVGAELRVLAERLAASQSLRGVLTRVLFSDQQRDALAVCRRTAIAVSYGENSLSWFDLVNRIVWPVSVNIPVYAASFSVDGVAWLLGADSNVVRLTPSTDDEDLLSTPIFDTATFRARDFEGKPRQITAVTDGVWVRSSTSMYWIPTVGDGKGKLEGLAWVLPAADAHLLLSGLSGPVQPHLLLTQAGDRLSLWSADGQELKNAATRTLPQPWAQWRLTHACSAATGLYLVFEGGPQRHVGLFDRQSLSPICHYVDDDEIPAQISDICADPLGRIYVRCGSVLYTLRP